ncbi:galectin-4-like [Anguilla anguilla]|uniref:galectin-4-like n=1 Tax=Anguilla anguilla TaxID=7936 RepID=UPI0015A95956|nr:galectin-4-like [Anguilla anguilla]
MSFLPPPGYQPIYNPDIPYVGPIYGGLRTGMSVYIQGMVPHGITRFYVNLQCGEMEGCDIAFHMNPRFDFWDKVVFNTFQNGCWEGEEKIHEMPFRKGHNFELVIVVNSEGYQVNVNGRQLYLFQHRMPVERVTALHINGDISVQSINIIGGGQGGMQGYQGGMGGGMQGYQGGMGGSMGGGMQGYPGNGMGGMGGGGGGGMGFPGGNLPMMGGEPIYNPCIPYSNMIPGGMIPKRTIIIRGMVPFGANRFAINFRVSNGEDIAFHFNARVAEGVLVRNSYMGGCWGQEERDVNFNPFAEGQYFDISVRCGNQRFKVYVNGQHLCNFSHRHQPFTQIDMLQIEGDVQLSYIHF